MPEEYNATQVAGGGRLYQRKPDADSVWQFYLWVEGEGKVRRSTKTRDLREATKIAERWTLEARHAQAQGFQVISTSVGVALDKYAEKQELRVATNQLRSAENIRYKYRFLRRLYERIVGLDKPISTLTQRDYDRVPQMRLEDGAAWETIRQELSNIRAFCRFARQFGNVVIPEWDFKIPQHIQKALGRAVTFTVDEHKRLSEALDRYVLPDTEDGRYVREWGINAYGKGQVKAPKNLDQNLEKTRRELTRFFFQIHCLCGARPGEMSSDEFGLRWKDITSKFVSVAPGKSRMISVIGIRGGKTGPRTVACTTGWWLNELHRWTAYKSPDDFIFADQCGLRAGKPVYLDALRNHFQEVCRRAEVKPGGKKPDLYMARSFYITRRLEVGGNINTIATNVGNSPLEIVRRYAFIVQTSDVVIKTIYPEAPEETRRSGVIFLPEDVSD